MPERAHRLESKESLTFYLGPNTVLYLEQKGAAPPPATVNPIQCF